MSKPGTTEAQSCYVEEQDLAYQTIRRSYRDGECLTLDPGYRLAHLPLVAPTHRDSINSAPDGSYVNGRYDKPRFSLVLPVDADLLESSAVFGKLNAAMSASRFSGKIAWSVMRQRRHHLHITLCGGLPFEELGTVADGVRSCLSQMGAMHVRIGGPLIGEKNVGRVYFAAYPERRAEENVFHRIQRAAGRPPTDLYLLGYYNLTDHLSVTETAELSAMIEAASSSEMMTFAARRVWIMQTNDDLALSAVVRDEIAPPATQRIDAGVSTM